MPTSLEADRARVKALDAQILNLRSERALIQDRIDSYKYPVLTLPNELVSEIFAHFLPTYPLCPPLTGILSPQLLLSICPTWRDIALSTPILWRAISLKTIPEDSLYDSAPWRPLVARPSAAERVGSWVGRSGSYPLSLQIVNEQFQTDDVLDVLVPHRARWEYVELCSMKLSTGHLLPIDGPLPLLRQLEIRESETLSSTMAFPDMPQLRTASVWHSGHAPALLPWAQLTSLTLVEREPVDCTRVLSHARNLRYCELVLYEDTAPLQPSIALLHLHTLVLVHWETDMSPARRYLLSFIVPALRRLQVPEECLLDRPIATLTSFISSSGCELQELRITGPHQTSEVAYRSAFPTIPRVTFNRWLTGWDCTEATELQARGLGAGVADFQS
ncbi:hypothetical protein DFH06DRAFT_438945 [Mycena polygramma]|nr:hypothetical protein DFH06DRAFT_438945 [Mycena polygramma]